MKRPSKRKWLAFILISLFLLTAVFASYVNDYYHSEESVQQYFEENDSITIEEIEHGLFIDGQGTDNAFIFYPGAKVEYTAYIPLLYQLAENGTDVFLVKMPCNLAFLSKNRADDILKNYHYSHWFIGGHSLGGAMASTYASEHLKELDGLALLAAYPTSSLKSDDFTVVSIYGSEDGILNMNKLKEGIEFMPSDYTEICISGGNHAQFGNYGFQEKDGTAHMSREKQQEQTVEAITEMITK